MALENMWGNFMWQIAWLLLTLYWVSLSATHMDCIGKNKGHKTIFLHGIQRGLFARCAGIMPPRHICIFPYIFQFLNHIYMFIYLLISVFDSFIIYNFDVARNNRLIMICYFLIIIIAYMILTFYRSSKDI